MDDTDALYAAIKHAVHTTAHRLFNGMGCTLAEAHDWSCQIYNVYFDGHRYQPDYDALNATPKEWPT